ncbi:FkbM family methyltransferase [Methylobacterium radiotolerans]
MKIAVPLEKFIVQHAGDIRNTEGGLIYNDGIGTDWHIITYRDQGFHGRFLKIAVDVSFINRGATKLYFNHAGGFDICMFDVNGNIDRITAKFASAERNLNAEGRWTVNVHYWSGTDVLAIGCYADGGYYSGTGSDQLVIHSIEVEPADQEDAPEAPEDIDQITFVDVGARGGFSPNVAMAGNEIRPILFEPDPEAAIELRKLVVNYSGAQVLEFALADMNCTKTLFITKEPGCSSLLWPNDSLLSNYPVGEYFEVVKKIPVECVRYDSLHGRDLVPAPDFLKIDVQGFEFEVLQGFGDLLSGCLGVELEAHLYPVYRNEKLLSEICGHLEKYDLVLTRLTPQNVDGFGGEFVEFNAWFIKRSRVLDGDLLKINKLQRIKQLWGF